LGIQIIYIALLPKPPCKESTMTDLRELLRRAMPLLNYALGVPSKELETQQLMNDIRAALLPELDAAGPSKLWGTGTIHGDNYSARAKILDSVGSTGSEPWYVTEEGMKWSASDVTYRPDTPIPPPQTSAGIICGRHGVQVGTTCPLCNPPAQAEGHPEQVDDPNLPAHPHTERCGFDRESSIQEDRYVCMCGYRDDDTQGKFGHLAPAPPAQAEGKARKRLLLEW
jgi:hypothetical protein